MLHGWSAVTERGGHFADVLSCRGFSGEAVGREFCGQVELQFVFEVLKVFDLRLDEIRGRTVFSERLWRGPGNANGGHGSGSCGLFELKAWAVVVAAHRVEREMVEEGVRDFLAGRTCIVGADEEVGDGGGDGGVLEDVVDDRAFLHPGRDENRRDADAEAVEVEGVEGASVCGLGDEAVGRAGGWGDVIVDAAVLVVDDEDGGAGPECGIAADLVVDGGDELFAGADVVVGMLVAGDGFAAAVGGVVVGVVGLNEAVVGERILVAGAEKVGEGAEEAGLALEEVDDLHSGACLIVVEEFNGVVDGEQAVVDALILLADVEEVHADLAKGGSVVGEGSVTDGGAGDRGEPAVEDGKLGGQRGEDR